jgi:hypothetical protein
MTEKITLKDGDLPRGFINEERVCLNCKHRSWNDLCKRHVYDIEDGEFYTEPTAMCAEWRER